MVGRVTIFVKLNNQVLFVLILSFLCPYSLPALSDHQKSLDISSFGLIFIHKGGICAILCTSINNL